MSEAQVSTTEAAGRLGFTVQHVRRLAREGTIQGEKYGRDWLISRASLERYIVREEFIELPIDSPTRDKSRPNGDLPAHPSVGNNRIQTRPDMQERTNGLTPAEDLLQLTNGTKFRTILADPPWQFQNRTGKVAPEHKRLSRYETMDLSEIKGLPIQKIIKEPAHLYLWVPNALLPEGLEVMRSWGFEYKTNLVWHKVRKDGGPDGRGVGFYFRNTTELVLFGVRGKNARTLSPGRSQVNIIKTRKREHSRKPDELYPIIEGCSNGPFLELFARGSRGGWACWGNESEDYVVDWATYANHSQKRTQTAQEQLPLSNGNSRQQSRQ